MFEGYPALTAWSSATGVSGEDAYDRVRVALASRFREDAHGLPIEGPDIWDPSEEDDHARHRLPKLWRLYIESGHMAARQARWNEYVKRVEPRIGWRLHSGGQVLENN
jgi:hypothetical protein